MTDREGIWFAKEESLRKKNLKYLTVKKNKREKN